MLSCRLGAVARGAIAVGTKAVAAARPVGRRVTSHGRVTDEARTHVWRGRRVHLQHAPYSRAESI